MGEEDMLLRLPNRSSREQGSSEALTEIRGLSGPPCFSISLVLRGGSSEVPCQQSTPQ